MNISDQHYFLERQRHDLALRMIGHEARTRTIQSCTGLSADRIRKLYRSYVLQSAATTILRHRGRTPHQAACFSRTVRIHFEASVLANGFVSFGLPLQSRSKAASALHLGQRFCDAYDTHRQLLPEAQLSFEHAWFLFQCLHQVKVLHLVRCRACDGRYLHDPLSTARHGCPTCRITCGRAHRSPRPRPGASGLPAGVS